MPAGRHVSCLDRVWCDTGPVTVTAMATLRCPAGHDGPWRFVETLDVIRDVYVDGGLLVVSRGWNAVWNPPMLECMAWVSDDVCGWRRSVPRFEWGPSG